MTQKDDLSRGTYLALKHNKIEDSITKLEDDLTWCGWRGKQEATALSTQHQTQSKQYFWTKYQKFRPKSFRHTLGSLKNKIYNFI